MKFPPYPHLLPVRKLRRHLRHAFVIGFLTTSAPSWAQQTYTWIETANNRTWTNLASWDDPQPPSGGPTAFDSINVGSDGILLLGGSRDITNVTSLVTGGVIAGGNPQNSQFIFTISNDLSVADGATLLMRNGSNNSNTTIAISVGGDVTVGASAGLDFGGNTAGNVGAIAGLEIAGQTTVSNGGALNLYHGTGWSPGMVLDLGDLNVQSGGGVTLAKGTLNGDYTRTVDARSLSGSGTIRANDDELSGANTRSVTVAVVTTGATDADFSGVLENGAAGSTLGLTVAGSGVQTLSGINTYTGATVVSGGTLLVDGSIASSSGVLVEAGATLGGHGTVAAISGAGTVGPGSSPGILTTSSVDGSGGLDFVFEFTQMQPDFGNPEASGNDVLRLTGATPFVLALGSGNTVTVDFSSVTLAEGVYLGGFYVDSGDFEAEIANANFQFVGLSGFDVMVSTVQHDALFNDGMVNGYVTQFTVVAIPEPGSVALAVFGGLGLWVWRVRRRTTGGVMQR